MGADLIYSSLLSRSDKVLDWDAGLALVDSIELEDIDSNAMEELSYDFTPPTDDPDDQAAYLEDVRQGIRDAITNLRSDWDGRNSGEFNIAGYRIHFIGGTSWGDGFDGMDEMSIVYGIPKIHEAIGFIPWPIDYSQEG